MPAAPRDNVAALKGLGPKSAALLAQLGIHDRAALCKRDAFELYAALKRIAPSTSLNMLYGLIAAQEGIDWRVIARERRGALLTELDTRARLQKRNLP